MPRSALPRVGASAKEKDEVEKKKTECKEKESRVAGLRARLAADCCHN